VCRLCVVHADRPGLGFTSLAASGRIPFWQQLMGTPAASNFSFPGFTFAITRYGNVSNAALTEFGGIFTLGTLQNDSFVNGTLDFVDVPQNLQSYWLVPLDSVGMGVNGTALPNLGTPNAAIDTCVRATSPI